MLHCMMLRCKFTLQTQIYKLDHLHCTYWKMKSGIHYTVVMQWFHILPFIVSQ